MNKGRKKSNNYEIGDLIWISISKIDRFSTDCLTLPCKILEKINNQYRLESQFEIINVFYSPKKIDPFGVNQFSELETILTNTITIRKAVCLQNVSSITGTICNCKGNCNSNRCCYKKMKNNCESWYHGSWQCQNKYEIN